ncbi:MAG TPA: hypothetical protein VIM51_07365 [Desulfosporosinus sp.]|jgi:hypothetical protein
METIAVSLNDQEINITGECLNSELYWAENIETFESVNAKDSVTVYTPTKCYSEVWKVEGTTIQLDKFVRGIGNWVITKHNKVFNRVRDSIEYRPSGSESFEFLRNKKKSV